MGKMSGKIAIEVPGKTAGGAELRSALGPFMSSDIGRTHVKIVDSIMNWGAHQIKDTAAIGTPGKGAGIDVGGQGGFTVDAGGVPRYDSPHAPIGSIPHHSDPYGPGHLAASHVVVRRDELDYMVGNTADYAVSVHDGTFITHPRPRPWLKNAFDLVAPKIVGKIKQYIESQGGIGASRAAKGEWGTLD